MFVWPAKLAAGCAIIGVVVLLGLSMVRADVQSGWLSTASPQLQKTVDLPANQTPLFSNRDCEQLQYSHSTLVNNIYKTSVSTGCFVNTTRGFMGSDGNPILLNNTSIGIRMIGYQNDNYLLQPIPNQGMTLSLTSASVLGMYGHFYADVSRHVTPQYDIFGGLQSYTVNAPPDFLLVDKNGAAINFNPDTIAYSSNGSWMLVDAYGRGFLRVNLATFEVTPFAQTLQNGPNDYSNRYGVTAISDDGRYASIGSDDYSYLHVYDLSTCTGTVPNDYTKQQSCQMRDYWPSLSSGISGFHALSSVRFDNDDNLNLTLIYNWHPATPNSFAAATYRLTAPGKSAHGLDYLAMGDSYISGQGEFVYKDGTDTATNTCHLSPLSYPFSIGAGLFNQYNSVACSGATTNDVVNGSDSYNTKSPQSKGKSDKSYDDEIYSNFLTGYRGQIKFVQKYQPSVVTLSIGGNDIDFTNMLTSCVSLAHLPTTGQTCYSSYDDVMRVIKNIDGIYQKLQDTYQAILQADPGVRLYVIGYPQIVTLGNCADNVHLNSQEIVFAQAVVGYLDSTIEKAANSAGARYVDTQNAFDGNRMCEAKSSDVAVNGLTAGNDVNVAFGIKAVGTESFHPNVLGHQLLAQKILSLTDNLTQPMPGADSSVVPPAPSDPQAQAILTNPTPSSNPVPDIVTSSTNLAPRVTTQNATITLTADGNQDGLKPNTVYKVLADTTTNSLGTTSSDSNGNINTPITLPASLAPGYHTIMLSGQNMAGQSIVIYEIIYVSLDGSQTTVGECGPIEPSGNDIDSDGIDDACDPIIGDAPKYQYPIAVHLTGNSIEIVNP